MQSVIAALLAVEVNEKLFPDRGKKEIKRNFLARFFDFFLFDSETTAVLFNERNEKVTNSYEEKKYLRELNSLQSTVFLFQTI